VLKHCRSAIATMEEWIDFMDEWWVVLRSKTEEEFDENWAAFEGNKTIPEGCKTYVWNTWLLEYKEKFVEAWTDEHLHLGTVDSSRVEGAHRTLKCYIKARNYNLRQTWKKIKLCIESQVRNLAIEDEKSRIGKLVSIQSNPLYKPILQKVTRRGFVLSPFFGLLLWCAPSIEA
jgi:hypothetical protein